VPCRALVVAGLLASLSSSALPLEVHPCGGDVFDEPCVVATVVDRSDAVVSARVIEKKPERSFARAIGDWALVVTGSRLGFPEPSNRLELRLRTVESIKGPVAGEFMAMYTAPMLGEPREGLWSIPGPIGRITEGREYLFCFRQTGAGLEVERFTDLAEWPGLPEAIAKYLRRDSALRPRRRTTRSRGRCARYADKSRASHEAA